MKVENYRIQIRGEYGNAEASEISGTIVGPFGVALYATSNGFYRVTHIHSGLKVAELGCRIRENALSAAQDLWNKVPWWKSHKAKRIAEENGLEPGELKRIVQSVAIANECDGHEDSNDWTAE